MRIIGGQLRGRQFTVPKRSSLRPSTDQAREGLFNLLQHRITLQDAQVLDLFAGTGAIGLECLSRGAAHATFVEQHRATARALQQRLADWGLAAQATVHTRPVAAYLAAAPAAPFDLIFLDPPYALPGKAERLAQLLVPTWLAPEGLLVLEHAQSEASPPHPGLVDARRYGDSVFSFYELPEASSAR